MKKNICVFCSSSDALGEKYRDGALVLGRKVGELGFDLVYGGATSGLMGLTAHSAQKYGSRVTGVIPESIERLGIANLDCNELILTRDLRERKAIMDSMADIFIVLPGGFGTIEEFMEILTLKQLQYHTKPIVLFNIAGFFNTMLDFFDEMYASHFAKDVYRSLFFVSDDLEEIFSYLETYTPPAFEGKWFHLKDVQN